MSVDPIFNLILSAKMGHVAVFILFVTVTTVTSQTSPQCDDIDTSACKLLQAQRPNLCSDQTLAKTTCPRFCKLCPVECYHCNATVLDYHLCNTTKLCGKNEVCMRKELKSFVDGHHEYEMTCAGREMCDGGNDLVIPFGKRAVESRDISVTCCADDLCNYPGGTQTTSHGCAKDIVFLVDETSNVARTQQAAVIKTIMDVVKRLNIGETDNLVALYGYADDLEEKFSLHQNTDQTSLLAALQSHNLNTHDRHSDPHDAIKALTRHVLQPGAGDRTTYPDAVVLISDSFLAHNVQLGLHDSADLQRASQDVILVSVGTQLNFLGLNNLDGLATDKNHILHVSDMYTPTDLVDSIVALLQKC
ncbi:uncharacterized protein LOC123559409 [Mercenaria mercenaria]|uniref:uncharacterized protein LOC123559409 n=1 Tax=Mercenaria mercenaria TaxID=6596 RepID=UPI00234E63E7|nr:uncharacterized protein LOC123559409 [Mercenaria mercenaria]